MKATDDPIEVAPIGEDAEETPSSLGGDEVFPGSPAAIFAQLDSQPLPTGRSLSLAHDEPLELDLDEPEDPMLGEEIGNFRILEVIGAGGFGKVYRAVHTMLGESFAVKLLKVSTQSNKEFVKRFQREARVLAQLKHDNVVNLADFGLLPDGGLYIIMEFLSGASLQQRLRAREPFPIPRMRHLMGQMCDVLGYIHRKGVIHRDLKPGNIFLVPDEDGREKLKLIDFGIAALHEEQNEPLTQTEAFIGTAKYASPEQIIGEDELDHRSDLYALGILLYRLIAGRLPFRGKGVMSVINQQLNNAPPTLGSLHSGRHWAPKLEAFMQLALAKERDQRPQSAQAFWRLCDEALLEQFEIDRSEGQAHTGVFVRPTVPRGDHSASHSNLSRSMAPQSRSGSLSHSALSASEQRRIKEAQRLAQISSPDTSDPSVSGARTNSLRRGSSGPILPTSVSGERRPLSQSGDRGDVFSTQEAAKKPSERLDAPTSSSASSGRLVPLDEASPHNSTYTPATSSIQTTGQHPTGLGRGFWIKFLLLMVIGSVCGYGVLYAISQFVQPKQKPDRRTVIDSSWQTKRKTPARRVLAKLPAIPRVPTPRREIGAATPSPRKPRVAPARPVTRRRRRRSRRRRRRRRVARRTIRRRVVRRPAVTAGPCGVAPAGKRWVYATLEKPQGSRPKINFMNCSACRLKRKGKAACLSIPAAKTSVKISVIVEGYQPCLHSLAGKARRLRWKLQEDDPSGLAVSYRCAWSSP